jgi:anti-anti-sigma regulatory factor
VDAIDAAGIGALVSLQASGIYLTLLNPTEQVREVLRVTQLESVFEIRESRATEELIVTPCATSARASI